MTRRCTVDKGLKKPPGGVMTECGGDFELSLVNASLHAHFL